MNAKAIELCQRGGFVKESSPVICALIEYACARAPIGVVVNDARAANAMRQALFRDMRTFESIVDRLALDGVTDEDVLKVCKPGANFPIWNVKKQAFDHGRDKWVDWYRSAACRLGMAAIAAKCGSLVASPINTIADLRRLSILNNSTFFEPKIWRYKKAAIVSFSASERRFTVRQHPPYDTCPTWWVFKFDDKGRITPVNIGLTERRALQRQRRFKTLLKS